MASFPPDRFDGVPDHLDRVGAHRGGRRAHHGLITFAWAALACGVLVLVGILLLKVVSDSSSFTDSSSPAASASTPAATTPSTSAPASPTPSATPTDAPVTDPSTLDFAVTQIAVLNGTSTSGLAATASGVLTTGGWKVASTGNAGTTTATSVVYYSASSPTNRNIALGIAAKLGIATAEQSSQYSNAITVVLGSDYAP